MSIGSRSSGQDLWCLTAARKRAPAREAGDVLQVPSTTLPPAGRYFVPQRYQMSDLMNVARIGLYRLQRKGSPAGMEHLIERQASVTEIRSNGEQLKNELVFETNLTTDTIHWIFNLCTLNSP